MALQKSNKRGLPLFDYIAPTPASGTEATTKVRSVVPALSVNTSEGGTLKVVNKQASFELLPLRGNNTVPAAVEKPS